MVKKEPKKIGKEHKFQGEFKEKIKQKPLVTVIDEKDIEREQNMYPESGQKCYKCGSPIRIIASMQLRSADEPQTAFFKCMKCNKTWRGSG